MTRWERQRLRILCGLLLLLAAAGGAWWWERAPLREAARAESQRRWSAGLRACQAYLARHPGHPEACRIAAQCSIALGRLRDADRYLTEATGLMPEDLKLHGLLLIQLNQWDRARVLLAAYADQHPQDLDTRMTLAALLVQVGRYNEAVEHARAVVASTAADPKLSLAEYLLGNALMARGDSTQAATHYRNALDAVHAGALPIPIPEQELRLEIAELFLASLQLEEAEEQLNRLATGEESRPEQIFLRGRCHRLHQNDSAAEQAWSEVLALQSNHAGTLLELGRLYFETGRLEQAIALLEKAATERPDSSQVHFLLGQAYAQSGDKGRSERSTSRFRELSAREEEMEREKLIIRGSPDHRDAQWYLAKHANRAGNLPLARSFLRRALKMDPQFEPARELWREIGDGDLPAGGTRVVGQ